MKISNVSLISILIVACLPSLYGQRGSRGNGEDILGNYYERLDRKRAPVPYEKQHRNTLAEYAPPVADVYESTVLIQQGDRGVALGAIVAPDGLIVTKASLIDTEDLQVSLPHRDEGVPAELIRIDEENDLALLWVREYDLKPVTWAPGSNAEIGSLVLASGTMERPLAVGTVSLTLRNLAEGRKGFLGIQMEALDDRDGLVVVMVIEGSGAERAGIERGDVILAIDEQVMRTQHDLINTISQREPGDDVIVLIDRRGNEQSVEVVLGDKESGIGVPYIPMHQMLDNTARMGGQLSHPEYRSGYPSAIQHDLMLKPAQCGGPLVDLDGHVVGINIARASRVKSYAIPSEVVQEWLGDTDTLANEVFATRLKNAEGVREVAEQNLRAAQRVEDEVRKDMADLKKHQEVRAAEEVAARLAAEEVAEAVGTEGGGVDVEMNDPGKR